MYDPGKDNYHHYKTVGKLPLVSFVSNDEENLFIVANSFMVLIQNSNSECTLGYLDQLSQVTIKDIPSSGKPNIMDGVNFQRIQIWTPDSSEQKVEQDTEQTRLTSLSQECKHPWVSSLSPFNMYRSDPVYQVPAHLTVKTACQILLKREGDNGIEATFKSLENLADMTIDAVFKQFLEDSEKAEEFNSILDFSYDK